MPGGVTLVMYFNFVPNSVKCVATLLPSVCLHCAVLDELHVRNGILKSGGIQDDSTDRRDRYAQRVDAGFVADTCCQGPTIKENLPLN